MPAIALRAEPFTHPSHLKTGRLPGHCGPANPYPLPTFPVCLPQACAALSSDHRGTSARAAESQSQQNTRESRLRATQASIFQVAASTLHPPALSCPRPSPLPLLLCFCCFSTAIIPNCTHHDTLFFATVSRNDDVEPSQEPEPAKNLPAHPSCRPAWRRPQVSRKGDLAEARRHFQACFQVFPVAAASAARPRKPATSLVICTLHPEAQPGHSTNFSRGFSTVQV